MENNDSWFPFARHRSKIVRVLLERQKIKIKTFRMPNSSRFCENNKVRKFWLRDPDLNSELMAIYGGRCIGTQDTFSEIYFCKPFPNCISDTDLLIQSGITVLRLFARNSIKMCILESPIWTDAVRSKVLTGVANLHPMGYYKLGSRLELTRMVL